MMRPTFLIERDEREAFVFGGKKTKWGVGPFRFDRFQLTDMVFIFNAQALQGVGLFRDVFRKPLSILPARPQLA